VAKKIAAGDRSKSSLQAISGLQARPAVGQGCQPSTGWQPWRAWSAPQAASVAAGGAPRQTARQQVGLWPLEYLEEISRLGC